MKIRWKTTQIFCDIYHEFILDAAIGKRGMINVHRLQPDLFTTYNTDKSNQSVNNI